MGAGLNEAGLVVAPDSAQLRSPWASPQSPAVESLLFPAGRDVAPSSSLSLGSAVNTGAALGPTHPGHTGHLQAAASSLPVLRWDLDPRMESWSGPSLGQAACVVS